MKVIDVVQAPERGEDKETTPLFDGPGRKLTLLTLRRGTALAEHASPDPVIIECVAGTGTLLVRGEGIPLVVGRRVVLEAGEPHGITAGHLLAIVLTRSTSAAHSPEHSHGGSR